MKFATLKAILTLNRNNKSPNPKYEEKILTSFFSFSEKYIEANPICVITNPELIATSFREAKRLPCRKLTSAITMNRRGGKNQ